MFGYALHTHMRASQNMDPKFEALGDWHLNHRMRPFAKYWDTEPFKSQPILETERLGSTSRLRAESVPESDKTLGKLLCPTFTSSALGRVPCSIQLMPPLPYQ